MGLFINADWPESRSVGGLILATQKCEMKVRIKGVKYHKIRNL